jgi:SAM-dependent methyltransferase
MSHGGDELWGERVAAGYDASLGDMSAPELIDATTRVLADLADGGPALEFAIGTGRIALPLSALGVEVHGIESSVPMAEQLGRKPGADRIAVTIGDMATTSVGHDFSLVYLVFNTITNLLTQDAQVACFANAAAHLAPGGHFVVETFVPQLQRLPAGEPFVPFDVSDTHIGIDEYDVAEQRVTSHHVYVRNGRAETFTSPHRYAWPAEYDLMAQMAGLSLAARWADWNRSPFVATSPSHISTWTKPT